MTHIEQAIREAVEKGGYELTYFRGIEGIRDDEIFLDPSFWQALGKARGWREIFNHTAKEKILGSCGPQWRVEWHRFIDHLAEGKDAESFFASLY